MSEHATTLRLILGDQLNAQHSWFTQTDDDVLYCIAELHSEATYTRHHWQKLCAFFLAMQNFAQALAKAGHRVRHLTLDDTQEHEAFATLIPELCKQFKVSRFEYQRPDEYRLEQQLSQLELPDGVSVQVCSSEHFLLDRTSMPKQFQAGKAHIMEAFYRRMRKQHNVLMNNGKPVEGRWNFDRHNRNAFTAKDISTIPEPLRFENNIGAIQKRLKRHDISGFGQIDEQILWPCTRQQAQALLAHFIQHALPKFGHYQDAMTAASDHAWSLYHSRLSFALNTKMLHPMQVISAVENAYKEDSQRVNIAQAEGYIRQILGWREYMRAMYWTNMPAYAKANALDANRKLPDYFWTGETQMNCMRQTITQSLEYAFAHHIQRLMITGNFCLLTGMDPDLVDDWYLGIYIDAIEWVEMPNTRGMSQYADGGLVATKPYISGGNYIHKMSDYCSDCHYSVTAKTSDKSCPFNSLYWHFLEEHKEKLAGNRRLSLVYKNWEKRSSDDQKAVIKRAKWCLENLAKL